MKYTLRVRITLIFVVGFFLVSLLFYAFERLQNEQYTDKIRTNQLNAINWLVSLYNKASLPENWDEYFKNFDLAYVRDIELRNNLLSEAKSISSNETPLGIAEMIEYEGEPFLKLKNQGVVILLRSTQQSPKNTLLLAYALSVALLGGFCFSFYGSLSPLRRLMADIKRFANGELDAMCNISAPKGEDEIEQLAYEFNKAACKIKDLLISRQLFLRTIMHELKTPIGKGRIMAEMLSEANQKERLISVFERLNMLINEFGKIEQLISKSYTLNLSDYHFSLVLEQVRDLLMLDDFSKHVFIKGKADPLLKVDFQLFSLAIKNLLDNAIKYSAERKAILEIYDDMLCIKNPGKELEYPIEHYMQAFVRGKGQKTSGMGLGLYIIDSICAMHKYSLKYKYIDGFHCFYVIFHEHK